MINIKITKKKNKIKTLAKIINSLSNILKLISKKFIDKQTSSYLSTSMALLGLHL